MRVELAGDAVRYASRRTGLGPDVSFEGRYWPTGPQYVAAAGSLDHFLTERYCLFTKTNAGQLLRGDVHHAPWPLQPAEAEIAVNTVGGGQGVMLDGPLALLHFSRSVDVALWRFVPVS
jgi:hypothetical protein